MIEKAKKGSPSKSVIHEHFVPREIAQSYECGARTASAAQELVVERALSGLFESRDGAGCILLIVAALETTKIRNGKTGLIIWDGSAPRSA